MPATSRRPTPTARMIDLLAEEKRSLLRTGFLFASRDPRLVYEDAVRMDVQRSRFRAILGDLKDEDLPDEARIGEVTATIDELTVAFSQLLGELPAMAAFEAAWDRSWNTMVVERAWPHATVERRSWRRVMLDCKPETRACFLGLPTPYQQVARALRKDLDDRRDDGPQHVIGSLVA